ncbi:neuropeptide CCHamide-1 receptor-like isoform X2 [Arctopsyche grandis]|uniref:neuropeptide CCHamide-1 receptor-like isoform X2 n=1 Tax=Arctopsyche grandis TaxID=121162 RepID=UPI00406D94B8
MKMVFEEITHNMTENRYVDSNLSSLRSSTSSDFLQNLSEVNSTVHLPYTPYSQRPETYIVPVIFAIIFVIGVLGNGTLVIVFIRHRAMRNIPNIYILSLALADLLIITTSLPFTSTVYTVESWPWGDVICRLSESIKDVSIGVSVFTLTALSADRFFAIVNPLKRWHANGGGSRATRVTIVATALIWFLGFLCAVPAAAGSYVRVFQVNPTTQFEACYPFPEQWGPKYARTIVLGRFLIYYAIPLTVIGVFYALMARHLVLSVKNIPGELLARRQVKARRKVAMMVLAFVVVFAICFLPYHVFMVWFYYSPTAQDDYNAFWHTFRIVGFCLTFMNSCVNPMALYCVSGAFRQHFNRYLLCRVSGRPASARDCRGTSVSLSVANKHNAVQTRGTPLIEFKRGQSDRTFTTINNIRNGRLEDIRRSSANI